MQDKSTRPREEQGQGYQEEGYHMEDALHVEAETIDAPTEEDVERLALAQAFMNAVGEVTSTKNPGNLRDKVASHLIDRYYSDPLAGKSNDVRIRGQKVGTFSLTVSKPTKPKESVDFRIDDKAALLGSGEFWDMANEYAIAHPDEVARWHFEKTGAIPSGCKANAYLEPGQPGGEVTRTTLRIDSQKVAEALGADLPEMARLLLEGGADA